MKQRVPSFDDFINEGRDPILKKWEDGSNNTKTFKVNVEGWYDHYVQGCKNCGKPVPLDNLHLERQMLGNAYQSLADCRFCGKPVILDEDKEDLLNVYLERAYEKPVDKIKKSDKNKVKYDENKTYYR